MTNSSKSNIKSIKKDSNIIGIVGICGVIGNLVSRIFMDKGFKVIGSDTSSKKNCRFIDSLENYDVEVFYGENSKEFFNKIDFIFLPPSIPKDAEIFNTIKEANIKLINLEDVLKEFTPSKSICITGTNGKTTTTTLLKHLAYSANLKPSEHNLLGMQGNNEFIPALQARLNGDVSILETGTDGTEKDLEKMVELINPSSGILTNITPDHLSKGLNLLDYAKIKGELIEGLKNKQLIINSDDPTIMGLIKKLNYTGDLITFGLEEKPSKKGYKPCWCGKDIEINEIITGVGTYSCTCGIKYEKPMYIGKNISLKDSTFTISGPDGDYNIKLGINGLHNIYNAMGAIVAAREFLNIPYEVIQDNISSFTGVGGRMENMGKIEDKTIIVDYAHNPAGVETVLRELEKIHGDLTVVITVSSESGHEGDINILNNALNHSKYIVPASSSSRKTAEEFINKNPNLEDKFIFTEIIPEEFKEKTLGSTEQNVYEGIKASLKTPVKTVIVIGEAAIKFKNVVNDF